MQRTSAWHRPPRVFSPDHLARTQATYTTWMKYIYQMCDSSRLPCSCSSVPQEWRGGLTYIWCSTRLVRAKRVCRARLTRRLALSSCHRLLLQRGPPPPLPPRTRRAQHQQAKGSPAAPPLLADALCVHMFESTRAPAVRPSSRPRSAATTPPTSRAWAWTTWRSVCAPSPSTAQPTARACCASYTAPWLGYPAFRIRGPGLPKGF